jgi:hypothetical protein
MSGPSATGRQRGPRSGRERDTGARTSRPSKGKSRGRLGQAPDACSLTRHRLAPANNLTPLTDVGNPDEDDPCPIRGHDHAHKLSATIQRHSQPAPATYLARNKTQIPSSSRRATVDFHRSSTGEAAGRGSSLPALTNGRDGSCSGRVVVLIMHLDRIGAPDRRVWSPTAGGQRMRGAGYHSGTLGTGRRVPGAGVFSI